MRLCFPIYKVEGRVSATASYCKHQRRECIWCTLTVPESRVNTQHALASINTSSAVVSQDPKLEVEEAEESVWIKPFPLYRDALPTSTSCLSATSLSVGTANRNIRLLVAFPTYTTNLYWHGFSPSTSAEKRQLTISCDNVATVWLAVMAIHLQDVFLSSYKSIHTLRNSKWLNIVLFHPPSKTQLQFVTPSPGSGVSYAVLNWDFWTTNEHEL